MFTVTKLQMIASAVRGHLACHCMVSLHRSARRAALQLEGIHNDLAVAILKNSNIVGHEPRNISWYFLRRSGSEMTCTVGVNGNYSIWETICKIVHVRIYVRTSQKMLTKGAL